MLQHSGAEGSNLDETGFSEFTDEVESIINGVDGVVEGDGGSVVGLGLVLSHVVDEG